MCSPLKKAPKGCKFRLDEGVKAVVMQWFQQQPRESFVEEIYQLLHQWNTCLHTHGDCF
jgi:hypothetical protein